MKTKLPFSKALFALTLSALLVGCSTSVNLSKKRYSDGYYVSISKKESAPKTNVSAVAKKEMVIVAAKKVKIETATLAEPVLRTEVASVKNISSKQEKIAVAASRLASSKTIATPANKKEDLKAAKKVSKLLKKNSDGEGAVWTLLLLILCFVLPPIAVGLATDWAVGPLLISILLTILFWLPGVIHALIVVLTH